MPAATAKLPGHLRNRCLAPTAVKLHFSAVPKPVRMPKAPESADPDAPKRKRGGQPGNSNRLKHGRYSAFAMPPAPPPLDPDAEDAARPWLLEEQLIDFGPRRRGAQPGNMNRMIHGQRSVRTRANNQRMKALLARGKAILAICNALAAMAERLVAQREAAAAIKPAESDAVHLPPLAGEVPHEVGGRGACLLPKFDSAPCPAPFPSLREGLPPHPIAFGNLPPSALRATSPVNGGRLEEDEGKQPHEYPDSAVPMPVRIPALPGHRSRDLRRTNANRPRGRRVSRYAEREMVRPRRLELPRELPHYHLKVARLPIPPWPHPFRREGRSKVGAYSNRHAAWEARC